MSATRKCLRCGQLGHWVKECQASADQWLESYKSYVANLKAKKAGGAAPAGQQGAQPMATQAANATQPTPAASAAPAPPPKKRDPRQPADEEDDPNAGMRDLDAPEETAEAAKVAAAAKPKSKAPKRPKLAVDHLDTKARYGMEYVHKTVADQFRAKFRGGKGNLPPGPASYAKTGADLRRLLETYQSWQSHVFPFTDFDDFISRVEKIGSTYQLKMQLREIRGKVHSVVPDRPSRSRPVREAGEAGDVAAGGEEEDRDRRAGGDVWGEEDDERFMDRPEAAEPMLDFDGELDDDPAALRDLLGGGRGSEGPSPAKRRDSLAAALAFGEEDEDEDEPMMQLDELDALVDDMGFDIPVDITA